MQASQPGPTCGQRGGITAESEDAFGLAAEPRAIFVECWLARLKIKVRNFPQSSFPNSRENGELAGAARSPGEGELTQGLLQERREVCACGHHSVIQSGLGITECFGPSTELETGGGFFPPRTAGF